MDIVNEIFKRIGRMIHKFFKKTFLFSNTARINGVIEKESKKADSIYLELGKKVYELYPTPLDEKFRNFYNEIRNSNEQIKYQKEQLQLIKGTKTCKNCGLEIPKDAIFCGACGYGAARELAIENNKTCPHCNKQLPADAVFCTICGQKIEPIVFIANEINDFKKVEEN